MLIDAHCHLANLSRNYQLSLLLDEAQLYGIDAYLSNALSKKEIEIYRSLDDLRVKFSAGVHPHYDECDLELEDIAFLCEQKLIWAVGEIGLDRKGPELIKQQSSFEAQLKLAVDFRLPAVLHIVGYQSQAWQLIQKYPLKYLVHGYAGSIEGFELLKRGNCWFTISSRLLKPDKARLLQEILQSGRYLFETDITYHYAQKTELNPLLRLVDLLTKVETISGINMAELLKVQEDNYHLLLGD